MRVRQPWTTEHEYDADRSTDAVSEPSERGCHIQAGTIDPEIAISQIVLCALVLLWATFAGI